MAAPATTLSTAAAASIWRSITMISGRLSGIAVNMAAGTVMGDASIGTDTLRSIELVRGTNFTDTYDATGFGRPAR